MSSRKAIPKKPLLQSNVLLRILVRILFKDFDTRAKTGWKPNGFPSPGQHPEEDRILFRILVKDYVVTAYLSDRLFLAIGHILLKISSKDFLRSRNQKNIRLTSV